MQKKTSQKFREILEQYLDEVMVQTNERDVSYFVLSFGGVFYEGPGIRNILDNDNATTLNFK